MTNNYKTILEADYGVDVVEARLITYDELTSSEFDCRSDTRTCAYSDYPWIYSTSYWTGSAYNTDNVWIINGSTGYFGNATKFSNSSLFGVRPVIVISKDYFN